MYVIWINGKWYEFVVEESEGVAKFVFGMQSSVMFLPIKK
jgi:hypothetical protein